MGQRKNPVVELVKAWEVFEQQHPNGTMEEFCRFQLQHEAMTEYSHQFNQTKEGMAGMRPADALTVTIGRLSKFHAFYSRKTMHNLPVHNGEDFAYLVVLHFEGGMRKSELINRNISEFTTGTNVINRLLKSELIDEFPDPHDARSRQVNITPKGVRWLYDCMPDMLTISNMLMSGAITEEEMQVAYMILNKLDRFHTQRFGELRNRKIDEIRRTLKVE